MRKFYHYTYARPVTAITDHKPLVSIANKPLSKAPKRLQSMFLNLQAFDYHLIYKPGAQLHVSDSLSRAPVSTSDDVYTCNNISDTPFNDSQSRDTCATFCVRQPKQPLLTYEVPSRPWQKVRTDIFSISGRNYLVTVDYFSAFIEVDYLQDITLATVIHKLKHQFARHGIPEVLISDNCTQYTSEEFAQFASEWKFQHTRSAPGNKKANGAAEATVKVIKNMMIKCRKFNEDPYIGLLNLRNTPTEGLATSSALRLMGRRT
ncbi:retrovirus-related pol polyprotein from transposon 17.6 [Plakobranchus ocellatus]|uniref:Retrovirus-related pol polyprotein from transposon 17.6 n=1 Tax=Plakobranchus ocellatus TaxID=259542 RepID=A0AAV4AEV2_9GAST|nr:retrovirus-related pol polyprotein from transposon 17.6 [Plakobranchus ocellatus]